MAIRYRQAVIEDFIELKQLGIKSYSQYRKVLSDENFKELDVYLHDEDEIIKLLKKSKCFVAIDMKIVGMAYFIPCGNPTAIYDAEWSYIRMVGVDPSYTGRGIGRELTQVCIQYAKDSGETVIALHTSEFMDSARHIYESCGFEKVKELTPIFDKRYWLYKLELKPEE